MNPKKTECYYNLGNAYCIQERFAEALECFENSIKHDPNHSAALYNLANTYYVLNDYDNAA
jgi:tetratricopeptide (TPR) repeat protein